jgi:hypothetical protein
MVTIEQFKRGVDTYFTNDVFPVLPDNKKFLAAFGTALIVGNIEKHPIMSTLGLIADNGMVEVERAYSAAMTASNVAPLVLELPIVGTMRFTSQDIEKLYQHIMR